MLALKWKNIFEMFWDREEKTRCQKPEQSTEPDCDIAQMLELSDRKWVTPVNMLTALVEKMDSMYDHMIVSEERRKG